MSRLCSNQLPTLTASCCIWDHLVRCDTRLGLLSRAVSPNPIPASHQTDTFDNCLDTQLCSWIYYNYFTRGEAESRCSFWYIILFARAVTKVVVNWLESPLDFSSVKTQVGFISVIPELCRYWRKTTTSITTICIWLPWHLNRWGVAIIRNWFYFLIWK